MPADSLEWLQAEARKRDSSASRLICDLIELERRASVFARLEALEKKVRELAEVTAERDALLRGEYICKKCGIRKDGEGVKGDF